MNRPQGRLDSIGGPYRLLITLAAFVIVIAGMRAAAEILVPFLLSAFVAMISGPPLLWMQRKGLPSWAALLIIFVVIGVLGLAIALVVGTSAADFTKDLPVYQERLRTSTSAVIEWLNGHGIEVSSQVLTESFDPGSIMQVIGNMITGIGGVLTNTILIIVTVIFILLEASGFSEKMRAAFGSSDREPPSFAPFMDKFKRYMVIKTIISLVTGIFIAVWLALIGVEYAILWGLLAFLLNFVPNIGSIIAAVPAVLLAIIQLGIAPAVLAAGGYLLVNMVIGNFIEPRFMGRGLGLSSLVVFLSLIFWGWVLGPVGMLLSVPLTMIVKIGLQSGHDTRWISVLLDSDPETKAEAPSN